MSAAISRPGFFPAAKTLILCALLLSGLWPIPASAGSVGPVAALSSAADRLSGAAFASSGLLLAMGSGGDDAGPARKNGGASFSGDDTDDLPFRSVLEGSFVGALIFGRPYQGLGTLDLIILALIGFLLVWRLMPDSRTGKSQGDDRFTVGRRDASSTELPRDFSSRIPPEAGQKKVERNWRGGQTSSDGGEEAAGRGHDSSGLPKRGVSRLGGPWAGRRSTDEPAERKSVRLGAVRDHEPFQRRSKPIRDQAETIWAKIGANAPEPAAVAPGVVLPEGFDPDDFLDGAHMLYCRLQEAWAMRDTDSLAPFATPEMLRLLREQAAADPQPIDMKILRLDATLVGLERQQTQEWADVAFCALMRFGPNAPAQVSETWRFIRERDTGGLWRLADIGEHEGWR